MGELMSGRLVQSAAVALAVLGSACTEKPAVPILSWYANPDDGTQAELAQLCSRASGGRYRIEVSVLPRDASAQREQLVRRLAARDRSIDFMSIDPPFLAELGAAGFLRPFEGEDAAELTDGVLAGPVESAHFAGQLFGVPFWANTQLLWFRKSVAARAGLDPERRPLTWSELVRAASATGTRVDVQARRYEGYTVWINALVSSAGGAILTNPEAGRDAVPGIDSEAGRRAAGIIAELASSPARNAALSSADEEAARLGFQGPRGGFMVNWPYVYGAADPSLLDDIGWARYPRVDPARESRPPLGGIVLGVSALSQSPDLAREAIRCITSEENQKLHMIRAKSPAARRAVYDDPEVRRVFPMADLVRESIESASPRPLTPYYTDVSAAVVRMFHPPASVNPQRTPAAASRLIVDVLHDRVLL